MAEIRAQRRLAAILAADVVGYSRLMEQDEAGTLAALKARRHDVLAPVVAQHNGRVVKVMGDGVLVEFASAVDAVQCAVELQKGFARVNEGVAEAHRIVLRIGINLGDVIVEGSDLYGDGVNVAARLEGLAEPGGIYVSATVHDHVIGKLELSFDDLGERTLKNIQKPVRMYRARQQSQQVMEPNPVNAPGRASIAVLPFTNMTNDPDQEFFTDGLTEDIITDLSNVPGFFVIASNSTFAYKGKPTDVRQIAQVLGVKYILEGSARRSAQRLRINVQLIDGGEGGTHIWAERFDRDLADIFVVQDEIARRVVEAITGKLANFPLVERYHPTNLEAYDLCVRARNLLTGDKPLSQERRILYERAVALDPGYCEAHWRLAMALTHNWLHWGEPEEPNRPNAIAHAQRAVDLDPNDSGAHWALGNILLYERSWDEAELHYETAIRLNPNNADALGSFADLKTFIGEPQQGVQFAERAMRLNPHPPQWYYWNLGFAQFANGQYDDAARTLRREETYRTASRRILAAALALLGRVTEAQMEAKLFLTASPHWRISKWAESQPFKNPKDVQLWIDGYRLAGLPE